MNLPQLSPNADAAEYEWYITNGVPLPPEWQAFHDWLANTPPGELQRLEDEMNYEICQANSDLPAGSATECSYLYNDALHWPAPQPKIARKRGRDWPQLVAAVVLFVVLACTFMIWAGG